MNDHPMDCCCPDCERESDVHAEVIALTAEGAAALRKFLNETTRKEE